MKYELTHDTIARQVFDKASTEARTRRKVEREIRERFEANQQRGTKLTQEDIDYLKPYLDQVNIRPEEEGYIHDCQKSLQRAKTRMQVIVAGTICILSLALAAAFYQNGQVNKQKEIAEKIAHALENKDSDQTLAFKFANEAYVMSGNQNLLALKTRRDLLQADHFFYQNKYADHTRNISCVIQNNAASQIISSDFGGTVIIRQAKNGEIVSELPHEAGVYSLALSHDEKRLLVACRDQHVYLYDVEKGTLLHQFPAHDASAQQVLFSHDDQYAFVSTAKGEIWVWSLIDYSQSQKATHHGKDIRTLRLSPDGSTLMATGAGGLFSLWNWQVDSLLLIDTTKNKKLIVSSAFHPDGKSIFTASAERIYQRNIETGKIMSSLPGLGAAIGTMALSDDGDHLLIGLDNGNVIYWNRNNKRGLYLIGQDAAISACLLSRDGNWAITGGKTLHRWNLEEQQIKEVEKPRASASGVSLFSQEGRFAVQGIGTQLQYRESGFDSAAANSWQVSAHEAPISALCPGPGTQYLASGSKAGEVFLWELSRQEVIRKFEGFALPIECLAISAEADRVAAVDESGDLKIWEIATAKLIYEGELDAYIVSAQFSSDGKHLLLGDLDGKLLLWKGENNGQSLTPLANIADGVNGVAFHPEGEQIVYSTRNFIIQKYLTRSDSLTFGPVFGRQLLYVGYVQGGDYLMGGTSDGSLLIWDTKQGHFVQEIKSLDESSMQLIVDVQIDPMPPYPIYLTYENGSTKRFINRLSIRK